MFRITLAFNLSFAALLMLSCVETHNYGSCLEETCYEVCEVYCDDWGLCWEECSHECYCSAAAVIECSSNRSCAGRRDACINGSCVTPPPSAGLCETCSEHDDCAESGALCLQLFGSTETVCGKSCTLDTDCPSSFVCSKLTDQDGSQCIPADNTCQSSPDQCASHADCPGDRTCENARCVVPPQPECSDTAPCAQGFSCNAGYCVSGCSSPSDCPAAHLCINSKCSQTCTTSQACPAASLCSNGICTADDRVECRFNTDCSADQLCVDANCVQACSDSTPCAAGYLCTLGFCSANASARCTAASDCAAGFACVDGSCHHSCAASCECPEGLSCHSDTGLCLDLSAPTTCAVSCDCPSGQTCSENQCQP